MNNGSELQKENANLLRLGFSGETGGAHASRTIMVDELGKLLDAVQDSLAKRDKYRLAIIEENTLGKRSAKTRTLTFRHLADLYGLDPDLLVFRGLRFFWDRDPGGRALLALQCAFARDALLRSSTPFISSKTEGVTVSRESMEAHIEALFPNRFSAATLKSTAQNLNSSWTKAGHLSGRAVKIRCQANPTPGNAAYAVFLGHLAGLRGLSLFSSPFAKLLDCGPDRSLELAQQAGQKGWLSINHIGDVFEVSFPNLLPRTDREWLQ
ncbi:hypothetical protein RNZ50_07065 [Paracoccaceae bacterium Fryx2]|nr:hypothetical protein [Paracoccaceae bacterium Fryx2]